MFGVCQQSLWCAMMNGYFSHFGRFINKFSTFLVCSISWLSFPLPSFIFLAAVLELLHQWSVVYLQIQRYKCSMCRNDVMCEYVRRTYDTVDVSLLDGATGWSKKLYHWLTVSHISQDSIFEVWLDI